MDIKAGQWIFTREWQGPVIEVTGVTSKRITGKESSGRRCMIAPDKVIAVSDTRDGAIAAERAHRETSTTHKADDLADLRRRRGQLRDQQAVLEREIAQAARDAAQAAALSLARGEQ